MRDADHAVAGSTFAPRAAKVGNEELENWLLRALTPKIHFRFFEVMVEIFAGRIEVTNPGTPLMDTQYGEKPESRVREQVGGGPRRRRGAGSPV